jgi:hypothetical protein
VAANREKNSKILCIKEFFVLEKLMNIENAIELIKKLHDGQFEKGGGPYWHHPVEVMKGLLPDANDEDRIIALFHDVPEDCSGRDWSRAKALVEEYGFTDYTKRGILLLTRIEGQYLHHETMELTSGSYMDYVRNITSSGHYGAIIGKYSDNLRNSDPERHARIADAADREKMEAMAASRYARAREIIEAELAHWKGRVRAQVS